MQLISVFKKELAAEAAITEKFLQLVPKDKFDWKPHSKSMALKPLAAHIAELSAWPYLTITTDGLDFATMDYKPADVKDAGELIALHQKSLKEGLSALSEENENKLDETWTMRMGEKILSEDSKADVIRMAINQIIHHRAQLGVYLRLLDIPIPGSYGPSADENNFQ